MPVCQVSLLRVNPTAWLLKRASQSLLIDTVAHIASYHRHGQKISSLLPSRTSSNARVSSNVIPPTAHPTSIARRGSFGDVPAPPLTASTQRSAHRFVNPNASVGPHSWGSTSSGLIFIIHKKAITKIGKPRAKMQENGVRRKYPKKKQSHPTF